MRKGDTVVITYLGSSGIKSPLSIGQKGKICKVRNCINTEVAEVKINDRKFVIPTKYLKRIS